MPERRRRSKRQWTRGRILGVAAGVCGAALIAATIYVTRSPLTDSRFGTPAALLEPGWQFYPRPTSLEPPGTVFRIDSGGRRFTVAEITAPVTSGAEASGASSLAIRTTARMLAHFLGGRENTVGEQGEHLEKIDFEMFDVQKEVTTDMGIADVLSAFRSKVERHQDNRYFVIRESRSALAVRYSLSDALVNSLKGSGGLSQMVNGDAGLSYEKRGSYVLDQKLPARMRVMFLAEEILPSSGLVGGQPRYHAVPIDEPLVWR
jgi:hypothetical protein